MSNNFIRNIDRTQSGATTPSQNEPGSGYNERVLRIPLILLRYTTNSIGPVG